MYLLSSLNLTRSESKLADAEFDKTISLREDADGPAEFSFEITDGDAFQFGAMSLNSVEFSGEQSGSTFGGPVGSGLGNNLDGVYASSSELGELSDNLLSLENGITTIKDGVTSAKEIVENIKSALGIFGKIEKAADLVSDIMNTFKVILKLVAKFPPLKIVANVLSDVFGDLTTEVRKLEAKAKKIDEQLEDEQQLAQDTIDELEGYEITLNDAATNVSNLRFTVDTADVVYGLISSSTSFDLSIIDNAVSFANDGFAAVDSLQTTVTNKVTAVTTAFDGVTGFLNLARGIDAQVTAISNSLGFLEGPLKILNTALKPIEWALDIVGFIFDIVVRPILDPILEALGINALFNGIKNKLLGLFPDIAILDDIEGAINGVFDDITGGITADILTPLTDYVNDIQSDILDSVLDTASSDEAIFFEIGGTEPQGGTGNDLITGNQNNNNLLGNEGDDVLVPGQGTDFVDGGLGNDSVIFNGNAGEFRIVRIDSDTIEIIHAKPQAGAPDQGTNTIEGVENFVFNDTTITIADLDNITTMTTTTFNGTSIRDFVFGSAGGDNINGGGGDDYLNGGDGVDFIQGGNGNDVLSGGGGSTDTLDGGNGFDTATFAGYASAVGVVLLEQNARDNNPTLLIPTETHFALDIEQLIGSSFDDMLYGDFGVNVLLGENGSDVLRGLWGNDVLSGGEGNDYLFGDLGNDELAGDAGDDLLATGSGSDTIDGGDGDDSLYYGSYNLPSQFIATLSNINYLGGATQAGVPARIVYDGAAGQVFKYDANGASIGTDTLSNIEVIIGANGNNVFTGTSASEDFWGGDGNDIFTQNGDASSVDNSYGGGGDDIFNLSFAGTEGAYGGDGDDSFIYSYSGELSDGYYLGLNGGSGYDIVDFSASAYALGPASGVLGFVGALGEATTTFMGISSVEEFIATDFDDDLDLTQGHFTLVYAGLGNDIVRGSFNAPTNTIYGGEGDDRLIANEVADATFYGGDGNDSFLGPIDYFEINPPNNEYYGGEGDDIFYAGASAEAMYGGNGIDRVDYTGFEFLTSSGVEIHMSDPNFTNFGFFAAGDTFSGIENVTGSTNPDIIYATDDVNEIIGSGGGDQLYGLAGDDTIYGGEGFDNLFGGDGDDFLHGGTSTNILNGGLGLGDTASFAFDGEHYGALKADLLDYVGPNAFVTAAGGAGTGSSNTMISIENIIGGGLDDDIRGDTQINSLTGAGGDDRLMGRGANDALIGGDGNDILDGGFGDDSLIGGEDSDRIFGGEGNDTVDYSFNESGITANLNSGIVNEAYLESAFVWADNFGTELRQSMLAGGMYSPSDVFETSPVDANDPSDLGFNFNIDTYGALLSLIDLIEYDGADEDAPMLMDFNYITVDTLETAIDILSGVENFTSGDGNDDITGSNVDNILIGNGGDDFIRGGYGSDSLYGGDGNDNLNGDAIGNFPISGMANLNIGGQDLRPNTDPSLAASYSGPTGEFLEALSVSSLAASAVTIEMLYQASEVIRAGQSLFSYAVSGTDNELLVYALADGTFQVIASGVAFNTGISTDTFLDGAVHRLSVTFQHVPFVGADDRGIVTLYVDGVNLGSLSIDNAAMGAIQSNGRVIIGQEQDDVDSNTTFDVQQIGSGYFGDIRIFDDLRTEAEINANLFTHASDTDIHLVENWIFDNGIENRTGTTVMTQTGGSITERGFGGNDMLFGGAGDDSLYGGGRDDILEGGAGADLINGGGGFDTAGYTGSSAGIVGNLNTNSVNGGDATGDTLVSIENLTGSAHDDILTGNSGDNILIGGAGNDTLKGLGGNDTLDGGDGDDTLQGAGADDLFIGGDGADIIDGATGRDIASYATSDGRVVVNLLNGSAAQNHAAGDVLTAIEDLVGSDFNDILTGTNTRNILNGGAGNDLLKGLSGKDDLFGEAGDDTLQGGGAADRLDGGAGNDTLNGGTARDVFVFSDNYGTDTIEDFVDNRDFIDLTAHTTLNSVGDVLAAATQVGTDVHITDGTSTLIIEDFNLGDLGPSDFIF